MCDLTLVACTYPYYHGAARAGEADGSARAGSGQAHSASTHYQGCTAPHTHSQSTHTRARCAQRARTHTASPGLATVLYCVQQHLSLQFSIPKIDMTRPQSLSRSMPCMWFRAVDLQFKTTWPELTLTEIFGAIHLLCTHRKGGRGSSAMRTPMYCCHSDVIICAYISEIWEFVRT